VARRKEIRAIQLMLTRRADPATKEWFENYLKHAIKYRGVKTPAIAEIFKEWRIKQGIADWDTPDQLELAADLIRQEHAEDKFAGILCLVS